MIEPSLALQAAIGNALADDPAVTALVEPTHIRGGQMRPDHYPCVLIGNGQTVFLGNAAGSQYVARAYVDVHIWSEEEGADMAKAIGFAVMNVLKAAPVTTNFAIDAFEPPAIRWMRDPDPAKSYCHGVMTFEAVMRWSV